MYSTEQKVSLLSASTGTSTAFLIPIGSDWPWRYEQYFHTENLVEFTLLVSHTGQWNSAHEFCA